MPIFQYDEYRNAYGPSIAEALAHQGDPQAAAALRTADVQARAAERTGALQGQLWSTLGAIPSQIQAQQAAAQRLAQERQQTQLTGLQLADAQAQHAADARLSQIYAATPRSPDGTFDTRGFMDRVPADLSKYAGPWMAQANSITDRLQAEDARQRGILQQQATGLYQAGAPPAQTQDLLDWAHQRRLMSDTQHANASASLAADPSQAKTLLQILAGPQKDETVAKDAVIVSPLTHRPVFSNVQPDKPPTPDRKLVEGITGRNGEPLFLNAHGDKVQLETAAGVNVMDPVLVKKNVPLPEQELNAYALSIGKSDAAALTYADRQIFDANKETIRASAAFQQHMKERNYDAAHPVRDTDPLVRVEHQDANGRAVVEWLPQSTLKGQVFNKPTTGALDNRLASAQTVTQIGNDLIAKLSDPAFASTVGPIMGRFDTLRQFVGNPPPEFSELAGEIESYALANMGVHGMRSYQGAKDISSHLLDRKMTPANLAAAIRGLNSFSGDLLKNQGRSVPTAPAPAAPATPAAAPNRDPLGLF
jgi:hypothetical protein